MGFGEIGLPKQYSGKIVREVSVPSHADHGRAFRPEREQTQVTLLLR